MERYGDSADIMEISTFPLLGEMQSKNVTCPCDNTLVLDRQRYLNNSPTNLNTKRFLADLSCSYLALGEIRSENSQLPFAL